MSYISDFQNAVNDVLGLSKTIRIKYYNTSFGAGSYYDDDVTLTQSGSNLWISGVILPITNKFGSNDAVLLEQGKILTNDTKLYIQGSMNTSGTLKIGLGSYTNMSGCEYSIIPEGITTWSVNGSPIVKKLYVRYLPTGSLIGE